MFTNQHKTLQKQNTFKYFVDSFHLNIEGNLKRGVAQSGSAHDWGSCGRWFKSSRPEFLSDNYKIQ